jgi:hypothetical protein
MILSPIEKFLTDFDELLHKKLIGKTPNQRKCLRSYYTKKYNETGQIPEALLIENSKRCCGRQELDDEIAKRFIELVEASATDNFNHPDFIPRRLRKISNFKALLEKEFDKKVAKNPLYRLVKQHNLDEFLKKPDFEDEKFKFTGKSHFRSVPVFDLIQIDGCVSKYLKIKDENNEWRSPVIISFMDTGSRFIFSMHLCFSESNQSATEAFCKFLKSTHFPEKEIKLRPDNGAAFLGLKRPITEINRKYSTPDGFFFEDDFARVLKAKDKVHLERSHKTLHNFEFFVIQEFKDRIASREQGTKFFCDRMEKVMITHLDITLNELKASEIMEKYRENHNNGSHIFTDDGQRMRWVPNQKLEEYLAGTHTFEISDKVVESLGVYGFTKDVISAPKSRNFVYRGRQYFIFREVNNFYKLRSMDKVRVSVSGDQLFIFEDKNDGTLILTAFTTQAPVMSKPEKRDRKKAEQNQYDKIISLLESRGMVINKKRLLREFESGLSLNIATQLVEQHAEKYSKYAGEKGFISFNLFLADYVNFNKAEVKPYADLRRVA